MSDFDTDNGTSEDFAALLDEYGGTGSVRLQVGDKVTAKVIHVSDTSAFFELSPTQEGSMSIEELLDKDGKVTVAPGDTVEVYVVGLRDGIELSRRVGRDHIDVDLLVSAQQSGMPVEGTVTGFNKGGLEVSIGAARGFCPMGQVDLEFVEDPATWVGQTLEFRVREVKERGRNVILSRRMLLEARRKEQAARLLETLEEGQEITGTVSRILKFGAFVDLGGIDGLIPVSELSHGRVEDVADAVELGQSVTVRVMRIEDDPKRPGEKRISLSLKATTPDPFDAHVASFSEGAVLEGTVVKLESFGAFVELFPGLQGLVHISELADRRIGHPKEVVEVGQSITVRVLGVEPERQRISLSAKGATQRPEGAPLAVGDRVTGTVDRIERYGVFLDLGDGNHALLPAAETGTERGTDMGRAFPMGTEIAVEVIEIDDRDRIKVSKKAREVADERANLAAFNRSQTETSKGFGTTFGDLLKKKR